MATRPGAVTSPPLEVPPELANTYWGSLVSAPVVRRDATGRISQVPGTYLGGKEPPRPEHLSNALQRAIFSSGGTQVTEEEGKKLAAMGWTYGQPAPEGFVYDPHGVLYNPPSGWKKVGQVAGMAIPLAATIATAGAASPWLAAAVGGAAALGSAKLQGASWKQALIAGGLGAAAGGLGASTASQGVKVAGQAGIGAARAANAGGGMREALLGAAQGGAGAAAATADPTGVRADVSSVADRVTGGAMSTPTLQQTLINTALATAAGGASGGTYGALLAGTGAAVAGAGAQSKNPAVQTATAAAPTLASRIMSGVQAGGQAAGNLAASREAGRQVEAGNITTQDQQRLSAEQLAENAHQNRGDLDLKRRDEGRTAQNDAFKNALRSALALNTQDVTATRPDGVPTISFSGGARPSAIGAQGRQAAELVNQRALDTLMNPDEDYYEMPAVETFTPSALPKASGVDTALGVAGGVASVLGSLQQQEQARQQGSLVQQLIARSQQDAQAGVAPAAAAATPPTVRSETDAIARRLAAAAAAGEANYDDEPWLGGGY